MKRVIIMLMVLKCSKHLFYSIDNRQDLYDALTLLDYNRNNQIGLPNGEDSSLAQNLIRNILQSQQHQGKSVYTNTCHALAIIF